MLTKIVLLAFVYQCMPNVYKVNFTVKLHYLQSAGTCRHMRGKTLLQKAKNALNSGACKSVEKSTVVFSMEVSYCRALQTPCLLVGLDMSCLDQNHGTVIAEGTSLSAEVNMFCTTASSDLIGG